MLGMSLELPSSYLRRGAAGGVLQDAERMLWMVSGGDVGQIAGKHFGTFAEDWAAEDLMAVADCSLAGVERQI